MTKYAQLADIYCARYFCIAVLPELISNCWRSADMRNSVVPYPPTGRRQTLDSYCRMIARSELSVSVSINRVTRSAARSRGRIVSETSAPATITDASRYRSEEHTSELQSH